MTTEEIALRYCFLAERGQFQTLMEELFDSLAMSFDPSLPQPYEHGRQRIIQRWQPPFPPHSSAIIRYSCQLEHIEQADTEEGHFSCLLTAELIQGGQPGPCLQKRVFCVVCQGKILVEKCFVRQTGLPVN